MLDARFVFKLYFTATDILYLCSHSDIDLPGVSASNIFYGSIRDIATRSQTLNPIRANAEIGSISFTFIDHSNAFTEAMDTRDKQTTPKGPRAKKIQQYEGVKGEAFADYDLIQTHQIYGRLKVGVDGSYKFQAQDIERTTLKTIFDTKKTTLTQSVSKTAITINAANTSDFAMIQHGAGWSDAPSQEVGYIRRGGEIMRWTAKTTTTFTIDNAQDTLSSAVAAFATTVPVTDASDFDTSGHGYITSGGNTSEIKWSGITSNVLQNVTGVMYAHASGATIVNSKGRGVFNSVAQAHNVDSTESNDDRKPVIEEFIYYELPTMKLLYAILTGTLYGSADVIPDHHHLNIDSSWVNTAEFTAIGNDIWDTTDDTAGFRAYGEGLTKTNGKRFIEEQINLLTGVFNPINPDGTLGLRRMTGVISTASYTAVLDKNAITYIDSIDYDFDDMFNQFFVDWSKSSLDNTYNRSALLEDATSQSKHELASEIKFKFDLLNSNIHTDSILRQQFNIWRDRYSNPPIKASIKVKRSVGRKLKLGQIVRLRLDNVRDFMSTTTTDFNSIDRSFEIQGLRDYAKGETEVILFASSGRFTPINIGNTSELSTSYYSGGVGAQTIKSYLDTTYGTDVKATQSGDLLTIIGDCTLPGNTSLSAQPEYYHLGDVTINNNITLTVDQNCHVGIQGNVNFAGSGSRIAVGDGLAGGSTVETNYKDKLYGTSGFIGDTQSMGGVAAAKVRLLGKIFWNYDCTYLENDYTKGVNNTIPVLALTNNAGILEGIPSDIRNTSGAKGKQYKVISGSSYAGGNGATGKGGLFLVCQGVTGTGKFNLNGNVGSAGASGSVSGENGSSFYAGTGAPSACATCYVVIDGNSTNIPDLTMVEAIMQAPAQPAEPMPQIKMGNKPRPPNPHVSYYTGHAEDLDASEAYFYTDYAPVNDSATKGADVTPDTPAPLPTAITASGNDNFPETSYGISTYTITVTPPASDNFYSHSIIKSKLSTDPEEAYKTHPEPAKNSMTFQVAMDGSAYDVRAYPVNTYNRVSEDFIQTGFTTSNSLGTITEGTIDSDVKQNNTNALSTDAIFINDPASLLNWQETIGGSWTVSDRSGVKQLGNVVSETSTEIYGYISRSLDLTAHSWAKARTLIAKVYNLYNDGGRFSLVAGRLLYGTTTNSHIGFYFENNGNLYATWSNGTTQYTYNLQTYAAATSYELKFVFTPGVDIKFYVDGVLKHTATTTSQFPTSAYSESLYYSAYKTNSGRTITHQIGEVKFHQAP